MKRVLEIRNYRLKVGSRTEFHRLVAEQSLPLHREWGMDVVNHGPSLHDPDVYFLMRAYADLDDLTRSQAAFYATDAWRKGPREAIVELIESDTNTVLWLPDVAIDALRGC
ncbi:NIPSNAP family protein [Aeromonas dhakensis]|uniref:NIPSNAP family protein n=1 Tax=Aeromonas dhakensis TaxID=196024 RepID=UPI00036971AB|nr:NIPSNAP family protein [Aeromonas dhakensis]